jgi:hypothetical protein
MTASDERELLLSYDEAVALLPDGERVHTFLQVPSLGMLIGADWDRAEVLELLRGAPRREVTGPEARSLGHGLCAWREDGVPVFIEASIPREPGHDCQEAGDLP